MRQWYEAGYFAGDVNVAASYYGEVPCTFWPISKLWQNPATEAFVLAEGVGETEPVSALKCVLSLKLPSQWTRSREVQCDHAPSSSQACHWPLLSCSGPLGS